MESNPPTIPRYQFWVIIGIVVLVCQLVAKSMPTGTWNDGIAFSLQVPLPFIYLVNLLLLALITVWAYRTPLGKWASVGAALVIGGGLANLVDRIINEGRVWDYIPFGPTGHFNLADVCVSVGLLLLFYFWFRKHDVKA